MVSSYKKMCYFGVLVVVLKLSAPEPFSLQGLAVGSIGDDIYKHLMFFLLFLGSLLKLDVYVLFVVQSLKSSYLK